MLAKRFINILLLLILCKALAAQTAKSLYKKEVHFEFNKWEIRPEDKKVLTAVLRAIKAQQNPYYITITGHTDNIDNNAYNYQLGLKRANAVAQYLMQRGADSSLMQLYSKGEEQKTVDNATDSLRMLNRRVEILLFSKQGGTSTTVKIDSAFSLTLKGFMVDSSNGQKLPGQILLFKQNKNGDNQLISSFLNTDSFTTTIYKANYEIAYAAKGFRTKNISYNFADSNFSPKREVRVLAPLSPLKVKRRVSFDKIHFYGNEARFVPSSGANLLEILRIAKLKDVAAIEIIGHVNYPYYYNQQDTNMIKFNFELSYNRAKAVYNYLVSNGVNPVIISYKGASNTEMKFPNARTDEEMQQNRRVEVLILEENIH